MNSPLDNSRKTNNPAQSDDSSWLNSDVVHGCDGTCVSELPIAFRFNGPHNRNLIRCKFWRTRRACQKVGSRNFSLPRHRYADGKIPAIPLRAFDIPASRDALWTLHRLQSCSPNTKGNTMSDTKKPAAKITLYPVSAAIWRNQNPSGVFYSVTFERSFKDDAGKWQSSATFNANDLLLLAKVADQAHSEIYKLRANDRQTHQPDEDAA
jgi:hypothetical protein